MSNLYDVNFNVYTSITVEANSKEEAEEEFFNLDNETIIERIVEAAKEGGVDVGTIELIEGEEPEEVDEEDDFDLEGLEF